MAELYDTFLEFLWIVFWWYLLTLFYILNQNSNAGWQYLEWQPKWMQPSQDIALTTASLLNDAYPLTESVK